MPLAAPRPCSRPGCSATVHPPQRWCVAHEQHDERKSKPRAREYGLASWQKLRATFLRQHPVCEHCGEPATVADHRTEWKRGGALLDQNNLRALCASCHAKLPGHFGGRERLESAS